MVCAIRAFLECCYIVRQNILNQTAINEFCISLECFHHYRKIFQTTGVRPEGFNLPRQHSLVHYPHLIKMFGAPNGLCSSITESKHIKAVKEPWRRSNRFDALGQMLLTNQRLDKLAASRVDFASRGMLHGTCLSDMFRAHANSMYVLIFSVVYSMSSLTDGNDNGDMGDSDNDSIMADDDGEDCDDDGIITDPSIHAHVQLARGISMHQVSFFT
jgi:hypothetical protein